MALDEIKEQIKALNPVKKDLRNLGLTFLVALVVIAGLFMVETKARLALAGGYRRCVRAMGFFVAGRP